MKIEVKCKCENTTMKTNRIHQKIMFQFFGLECLKEFNPKCAQILRKTLRKFKPKSLKNIACKKE
jgi:hypothetical protein